ncbi:MAG: DUF2007 domain-containing protein [Chloroflexi bacterium]|nr:DUF2007 domain-containing protein [Chloroflexota bacterium]
MSTDDDKLRGGLAVVYVTSGQLNGHLIKSKLESEGIPAILQYESAGLVYGLVVDGLGNVKVLVPEEYLDRAKQVLEGIDI